MFHMYIKVLEFFFTTNVSLLKTYIYFNLKKLGIKSRTNMYNFQTFAYVHKRIILLFSSQLFPNLKYEFVSI